MKEKVGKKIFPSPTAYIHGKIPEMPPSTEKEVGCLVKKFPKIGKTPWNNNASWREGGGVGGVTRLMISEGFPLLYVGDHGTPE